MKPHLQYLRYVLLHKLYVFRAGLLLRPLSIAWLWRLLVHDLSKFGRAEWGPYVQMFYGPKPPPPPARDPRAPEPHVVVSDELRQRQAAFNRAWLHHIHVNDHHWQHHVLHEDSGKTLVLLPEAIVADEMLADWMGAGQKILARPTLRVCVGETIRWYAANHAKMQLRQPVRDRIEASLMHLADVYGFVGHALELHAATTARASLVIPGRE